MSDVYYVITPPTGTVVSLAEAKLHLRVDDCEVGAKASKTFGSGNSTLVLTARVEGPSANDWQAVIVSSGANTPLSVSLASNIFTINLATNGSSVATSTVNDVISKLLSTPSIAQKITATSGSGTGTGLLAAATIASFTGGLDGHSFEDDLISGLLLAAQNVAENILRKKLLTQTMGKKMKYFPGDGETIELDYGNVQSVTSVAYYDYKNTLTTLTTPYTLFTLENNTVPAELELALNKVWPSTENHREYPITITYVVGYGTAEQVPEEIKLAIKHLVAHWYTNKESVQIGPGITALVVPQAAEFLLWPHRDFRFI